MYKAIDIGRITALNVPSYTLIVLMKNEKAQKQFLQQVELFLRDKQAFLQILFCCFEFSSRADMLI